MNEGFLDDPLEEYRPKSFFGRLVMGLVLAVAELVVKVAVWAGMLACLAALLAGAVFAGWLAARAVPPAWAAPAWVGAGLIALVLEVRTIAWMGDGE